MPCLCAAVTLSGFIVALLYIPMHEVLPEISHPCTDAASTGGDFEVSIQVLDGPTGEEAFDHQKNAIHKERWGNAIDHILDNVNAVGNGGNKVNDYICMGKKRLIHF